MKRAEPIKLMAWQFTYLKGEAEHKFETMPFYLNTLRSFLRRNLGKVVWIKGAYVEKPAYLLFYSELYDEIFKLLVKPLKDGGRFGVIPVKNPTQVARKYLREERLTVGYLDLGPAGYIGTIESISTDKEAEIIRKIRNGFLLTNYQFIKADKIQIKGEWCILENVVELGLNNGKITYVHKQPKMGLRVSDIKFHPTTLKELKADAT